MEANLLSFISKQIIITQNKLKLAKITMRRFLISCMVMDADLDLATTISEYFLKIVEYVELDYV